LQEPNWRLARREDLARRISCVETTLDSGLEENEDDGAGTEREGRRAGRRLAVQIVEGCVLGQERDERMDWNLKLAFLHWHCYGKQTIFLFSRKEMPSYSALAF
jgi:hypothetical protein